MDERIAWIANELRKAKKQVATLEDHLKNMQKNRELVATMDGYDD